MRTAFRSFAKLPNKLVFTDESADSILCYTDFGIFLSLYSLHLLICVH